MNRLTALLCSGLVHAFLYSSMINEDEEGDAMSDIKKVGRVVLGLVVAASLVMGITGCKTKKDAEAKSSTGTEHPAGGEHPTDGKPKDHPAH